MEFVQFDYQSPKNSDSTDSVADWWSDHWRSRSGLRDDQSHESSWSVIREYVGTGGTILEAGCGVPNWVKHFQNRGLDAIGVDFAPTGLRIGKDCDPSLKLIQSDFRELAIKSDTLDYILSLGAIEHDPAGPDRALSEFNRVLKPGGRLLCSVPCLNLPRRLGFPYLVLINWLKKQELLRRIWKKTDPFEFYQFVWSPAMYKRILESSGFRVLAIKGYGYPKSKFGISAWLNSRDPLFSPHMMIAICEPRKD